MIRIIDNALSNPESYREKVLALDFKSYDFGHCVFHGIAVQGPSGELLQRIHEDLPDLKPTLTFFRKSPHGQVEPHFIHTDIDMGQWSAILYLNLIPKEGDGTCFWEHRETSAVESLVPHERSEDGRDPDNWVMRQRVDAKFNRLLMFPSSYFHSRSIHENWGDGNDARLIQVAFGTGALT